MILRLGTLHEAVTDVSSTVSLTFNFNGTTVYIFNVLNLEVEQLFQVLFSALLITPIG